MTGLVLEGGANRTYYTIGILDAFLDNGIETQMLVGVSAGIANGISYISRQRGRGLELGMKYISDKRYMGMKYFFKKGNKSYYNIDFVFRDIPERELPFDYASYKNFTGDVYAVVTNLETACPEYIKVDDYNESWKVILASCALPFMFSPVEINGRYYMDGGCSNPLPVKFAYDYGCDKVITVLTREREYRKQKDNESIMSSFFFRKNKVFANVLKNRSKVYNESREYIFNKENEGSAFVFAPKDTKLWKRTEKSPQMLKKMYDEGYNDAISRMDELKKFLAD